MTAKSSKGIIHLKSGHGKPGSGVVARHSNGLVTFGGKLDDGRWCFMAVTADQRGAFAVGETHTEAAEGACEELGLSKAKIIGGKFARQATGR